jgi:hypothetical protein
MDDATLIAVVARFHRDGGATVDGILEPAMLAPLERRLDSDLVVMLAEWRSFEEHRSEVPPGA